MLRAALLGLLVALLATGCGGASADDDTFAYDADAPLALETGAQLADGRPLDVREISFASGEEQVDGVLVAPPRSEGRVPAVVYLHGSGGDRTQLLPLASSLATRGAVALTLTLPSGDATPPTGLSAEETLRWQRDTIVADVVAVRRALDVLAADERVDPERLGLVGWSFGGRIGALVAGIDERVRATTLMSAGAAPVSEYVAAAPADLRDDVEEVLTPIDPLTRIGEATGRAPPPGRPVGLRRAGGRAPGAGGRRARRRRASLVRHRARPRRPRAPRAARVALGRSSVSRRGP